MAGRTSLPARHLRRLTPRKPWARYDCRPMDRRDPLMPPAPDPLLAALKREMLPGERLLWSGKPEPGAASFAAFGIWLFAVPWTAFALFWTAMAWNSVGGADANGGIVSYAFPLFGLPFILTGLAMLSAPLWARRAAEKTIFGITDQRVVSLTQLWRLRINSVSADQIGPMKRVERKDGSGSLKIETHSTRGSKGVRRTQNFHFTAVPNVRHVERLIRELTDGGVYA